MCFGRTAKYIVCNYGTMLDYISCLTYKGTFDEKTILGVRYIYAVVFFSELKPQLLDKLIFYCFYLFFLVTLFYA